MVTVSQLYSLYCAGHAEARRVSDGGVLRAFEVTVDGKGITALERVILELALHDATNGTPMRSRQSFDRAVEQGADLPRDAHGGAARSSAPETCAAPLPHFPSHLAM